MTDDELEVYNDTLRFFAGIALPGVLARVSIFADNVEVAKKAFDIAEAMMVESKKRQKTCEQQ